MPSDARAVPVSVGTAIMAPAHKLRRAAVLWFEFSLTECCNIYRTASVDREKGVG